MKQVMTMPMVSRAIDEALATDNAARVLRDLETPPVIDRMSASGRCYRDRWATFKGLPLDPGKGFEPNVLKIFRLGHIIEDEVVSLLEDAGLFIYDQQREVGKDDWLGHIDGLVRLDGREYLLEIKSANKNRFEELLEFGYEVWNPGYSAQLHAYMAHLPGIEEAMAVVYCKDDSRVHVERILLDVDIARRLEAEHQLAVSGGSMPPKKPKSATSQSCKFCRWCDRNQWCWSAATEVEFDD